MKEVLLFSKIVNCQTSNRTSYKFLNQTSLNTIRMHITSTLTLQLSPQSSLHFSRVILHVEGQDEAKWRHSLNFSAGGVCITNWYIFLYAHVYNFVTHFPTHLLRIKDRDEAYAHSLRYVIGPFPQMHFGRKVSRPLGRWRKHVTHFSHLVNTILRIPFGASFVICLPI